MEPTRGIVVAPCTHVRVFQHAAPSPVPSAQLHQIRTVDNWDRIRGRGYAPLPVHPVAIYLFHRRVDNMVYTGATSPRRVSRAYLQTRSGGERTPMDCAERV